MNIYDRCGHIAFRSDLKWSHQTPFYIVFMIAKKVNIVGALRPETLTTEDTKSDGVRRRRSEMEKDRDGEGETEKERDGGGAEMEKERDEEEEGERWSRRRRETEKEQDGEGGEKQRRGEMET